VTGTVIVFEPEVEIAIDPWYVPAGKPAGTTLAVRVPVPEVGLTINHCGVPAGTVAAAVKVVPAGCTVIVFCTVLFVAPI
jgi:hypothetical protein